jgi:hypothetical protein
VSCVRNGGTCLCPRCLIPRNRVQNLGMTLDMKQRQTLARVDDESRTRLIERAREIIYRKNYAVDTDAVEAILKEQSLVPTLVCSENALSMHYLIFSPFQGAFTEKLGRFGFDHFKMLLVDLMHEFELGVWKALFIHLLRILNALDKAQIHELDRR